MSKNTQKSKSFGLVGIFLMSLFVAMVSTAPVVSERALEGQARFRDAYESRYQRSLVGATASVGYDAALLLLEALRAGRIEPDEVRESFESLEGISGATGVFSVVRGRVVLGASCPGASCPGGELSRGELS